VLVGGLALFVLVAHVQPMDFVAEEQVALRDVGLTGEADHADFKAAVEQADEVLPEGTAIFVVGNRDDWWHQQLWAPSYSDARFFYDDWMWYWHARHAGPYDPANGYWMPNPTDALEGDYLDRSGIGVVLVSDMWVPSGVPPRDSARTNPRLEPVATFGAWDVYTVADPSSIVTHGDALPTEIDVTNHDIRASFDDGDGTVVVRQNWFPRWTATVNGEPVEITRRDDGFMELQVPPGPLEVHLTYGVTALDWAGRAASVAGIVLLAAGIWRGPALLRRLDDGSRVTLSSPPPEQRTPDQT
jgi:hypothetical protein